MSTDELTPENHPWTMVEEDAGLARLCDQWMQCRLLAVDTEFIRTSTFYPKAGLLQINDGEMSYLIDPLAIRDWQPFIAVMQAPSVVKVLHSCSEDLLVFIHLLGILPQPLFDTQVAGNLLNQGVSLSYQRMVKEHLDIDIPKDETRSDWLQRPLSREQLAYAALDVEHLLEIARSQGVLLAAQGRQHWVEEECRRLLALYDNELRGDFSDTYQQIKTAWQLKPRQLAVLRILSEWREQRARKRDKPRNWIIRDNQLMDIARAMPENRQALQECTELNRNFMRYEGDSVLALVREACDLPESELPPPEPQPLTQGQKKKLKAAKDLVDDKAEHLQLAPEILARKRGLISLFQAVLEARKAHPDKTLEEADVAIPEELRGWRKPLLVKDLIGIMS